MVAAFVEGASKLTKCLVFIVVALASVAPACIHILISKLESP
jgi:hypothetical protein